MLKKVTLSVCLAFCFLSGVAQEEKQLSYADQLLALEKELDSLSIFHLLDSILLLPSPISSELNVRMGFNSSVTSAGRDYDIDQTGLSPGISYFHKSGIYSDVSAFWNSNASPNYNPTIFSIGYLGSVKNNWGYSIDYEHWFYNPKDSSDNPLTHSISGGINYDIKKISLNLDYSYLFGQATSHRMIGSATINLDFGKWWSFKKVSLLPSATIAIGNGEITNLRITQQQLNQENINRIARIQALTKLTDEQINYVRLLANRAFRNDLITQQQLTSIRSAIRRNNSISEQQLAELNQLVQEGFQQQSFVDETSFGVLNYSLTLPLSLSTNSLNFLLSYTYSIPVKLPGEFFEVNPIGYFGAAISYRISLNK
ncbi:MAG: hypothetical protein AAGA66_18190 [Bacteroidota bacterium]